jgi:hypothetical protein
VVESGGDSHRLMTIGNRVSGHSLAGGAPGQ